MRISILGPPGVGKGTYSNSLSKMLGIPHFSPGEIFKQEISRNTDLGKEVKTYVEKGLLVPDEIVVKVVERAVKTLGKNGFIIDGYPRTLYQAEYSEKVFPVDIAVFLNAPDEVILKRISGRLRCPVCGKTYHVEWNPPKKKWVCDVCGAELVRRSDDEIEIVKKRLEVYRKNIFPILRFYDKRGKLLEFDASIDSRLGIPILAEKIVSIVNVREIKL